MVIFDKNGIFGIGLNCEDIRALRAGCGIKIPIENKDIEVFVFYRESDEDMLKFQIGVDEYAQQLDTELFIV